MAKSTIGSKVTAEAWRPYPFPCVDLGDVGRLGDDNTPTP